MITIKFQDQTISFPDDATDDEIRQVLNSTFPVNKPIVKVPKSKKDIKSVIESAASIVGVDPQVLLAIAKVESNFDPNAVNKISQASGLFQFIKGTWKDMVNKFGQKHGIDLNEILDPLANAIMAAEFTKVNQTSLSKVLGREPNLEETYLAHFSGLAGAKKALKAKLADPSAKASTVWGKKAIAGNKKLLGGGITVTEAIQNLTKFVTKAANIQPTQVSNKIAQIPVIEAEAVEEVNFFADRKKKRAENPIDALGEVPEFLREEFLAPKEEETGLAVVTETEEEAVSRQLEFRERLGIGEFGIQSEPQKNKLTEDEEIDKLGKFMEPGFFQRDSGTFFEITPEGEMIEHGN